ncbi:hypothetical protein CDAR_90761 [Caerostris darwini]|uniref:Uncharacterized protein n=1 Tax=Caerostris darwini TaxID=1538125 RepID=A0AAV4RPD0_9ARAC|nr:hypothetical protein CDAR_90761 [Caerostris darwini]
MTQPTKTANPDPNSDAVRRTAFVLSKDVVQGFRSRSEKENHSEDGLDAKGDRQTLIDASKTLIVPGNSS